MKGLRTWKRGIAGGQAAGITGGSSFDRQEKS